MYPRTNLGEQIVGVTATPARSWRCQPPFAGRPAVFPVTPPVRLLEIVADWHILTVIRNLASSVNRGGRAAARFGRIPSPSACGVDWV